MNTIIAIARLIAGVLASGVSLACLVMVAYAIFDPFTDDMAEKEPLVHNFAVFILTMVGGLGLMSSWQISWSPLLGY